MCVLVASGLHIGQEIINMSPHSILFNIMDTRRYQASSALCLKLNCEDGSVLHRVEWELEDDCETEAHTNDTVFFFFPLY